MTYVRCKLCKGANVYKGDRCPECEGGMKPKNDKDKELWRMGFILGAGRPPTYEEIEAYHKNKESWLVMILNKGL